MGKQKFSRTIRVVHLNYSVTDGNRYYYEIFSDLTSSYQLKAPFLFFSFLFCHLIFGPMRAASALQFILALSFLAGASY